MAHNDETRSHDSSDGLSDLDDDFDLAGFREQRLDALKREMDKAKAMKDSNYGRVSEIKDEKEVMQATLKSKLSVVHFFHKDFRRCAIMDQHLEKLATKYFSTLFVRVDVANVPFLVEKLEIRILPCVVCFVEGVSKDRIIGFEGLTESSDVDSFSTTALEMRMRACGVLSDSGTSQPRRAQFGFKEKKTIDGDESD